MVSIKACLLQVVTVYGVNKDLFDTSRRIIWGQKGLFCYK